VLWHRISPSSLSPAQVGSHWGLLVFLVDTCALLGTAMLLRSRRSPTAGRLTVIQVLQASYDPNNIAALLQQYPYHIDSLMAMFDLYRVRGRRPTVSSPANHLTDTSLWVSTLFAAWLP